MAEVTPGAVAPAVPVAPAANAAPDIQSTADGLPEVPEGDEQPEAKERTFTQAELDAINAKTKAQADRRALKAAARVEAERDLYKQQLEEARKPAQQQPQGRPQQKDFPDWEAWNEAVTDWKVEQRLGKMREEGTAQQQQREAQQSEAQLARSIQDNFKAAAEKYADFHEVVTAEGLPFHKGSPILAYVAKSKAGGDIAYHLGNDPTEAIRIAELHPIDQILALRDLEAKLTAAPKPTNTPAPIVPNRGNSAGSKSLSDLIGGSQEEFEKRRASFKRK